MTNRCGFCAILGAPNAGKSTLTNALVGSKIAIVSPKVQTTRMRVRGVAMSGETQIVFVDTPGIFKPRRRLDRAMVGAAWAGAEDADAILLLVDAADLTQHPQSPGARDTETILAGLKNVAGKKMALVLNKIDGMKRTDLLPLTEKFHAQGSFEDVFLVSALSGDGVEDVSRWVAARMPEGPWLYPEDQAADIPLLLAGEVFAYDAHRAYFEDEIRPRLDGRRKFIGAVAGMFHIKIPAANGKSHTFNFIGTLPQSAEEAKFLLGLIRNPM